MRSRREIFFENYRKIVGIEARTMVEMTERDILPAVSSYVSKLAEGINQKRAALPSVDLPFEVGTAEKLTDLMAKTVAAKAALEKAEHTAEGKPTDEERAMYTKDTVLPKMDALRSLVDTMETLTAREYWPMPTYGDLTYRV